MTRPRDALVRLMAHTVRTETGCLEFTGSTSNGYSRVWVIDGSRRRLVPGHRLVMERSLGHPIPEGQVVRHTCDNPPCVEIAHLELGSHADNTRDKIDRGRSNFGVWNGQSKLTDLTAVEARRMIVAGRSHTEVARHFNVARCTIDKLAKNETWRHVELTPEHYSPPAQRHNRRDYADRVEAGLSAGMSRREIADEIGRPEYAVVRSLRRHGHADLAVAFAAATQRPGECRAAAERDAEARTVMDSLRGMFDPMTGRPAGGAW